MTSKHPNASSDDCSTLIELIRSEFAKQWRIPLSRLDIDKNLYNIGLDSMGIIRLIYITREISEVYISVRSILDMNDITIRRLSEKALEEKRKLKLDREA